ncbi:hypothetical protein B4113_0554 [Geobacillus sp. B4113_201601]|nr:hypothetical protein B4113_0554 [Geobacillus sp. B4113_201601]
MQEHFHFTTDRAKIQKQYAARLSQEFVGDFFDISILWIYLD